MYSQHLKMAALPLRLSNRIQIRVGLGQLLSSGKGSLARGGDPH